MKKETVAKMYKRNFSYIFFLLALPIIFLRNSVAIPSDTLCLMVYLLGMCAYISEILIAKQYFNNLIKEAKEGNK